MQAFPTFFENPVLEHTTHSVRDAGWNVSGCPAAVVSGSPVEGSTRVPSAKSAA